MSSVLNIGATKLLGCDPKTINHLWYEPDGSHKSRGKIDSHHHFREREEYDDMVLQSPCDTEFLKQEKVRNETNWPMRDPVTTKQTMQNSESLTIFKIDKISYMSQNSITAKKT